MTPELAMAVIERLKQKTVKSGDCLIWVGGVGSSGYGVMSIHNRSVNTHQASWIAHNGEVPDGMCVCHKCDVRRCVNPDHLFLGTKGENNRDRCAKGRNADRRGENNTQARLTDEQVNEIRKMCANGITQRKIAEKFGISQQHVSGIKRGIFRPTKAGVRLRVNEDGLW